MANDRILGPNQKEGVHCFGGCTVNNVWWDAVCEDAFTVKEQSDGESTSVTGGGAKDASDKVIQHNGGGTVIISDFTVSNFGKLYRSCGNCNSQTTRHVQVTGGSASDGSVLVGINSNYGDTASISGVSVSGVDKECVTYEGNNDGSEPSEVGTCDGNSGGGSTPTPTSGSSSTPTPNAYNPGNASQVEDDDEAEDEEEDDNEDDDEEEDEDDDEEDGDDQQGNQPQQKPQGQPWEQWFQ